ncbi:MAG: alpha/beta hydrolase [Anaerolineae bacterium]|jgi:pimeloyl-ACP methyl ester carboxylesterase|nr:alpha/beta hydrolase [Anaerolineae bacterium]
MVTERVNFSSEGIAISGLFFLPEERPAEKLPCVILVHGFSNSKDEFGGFPNLAAKLNEKRISALSFDFRGCGESGSKPGWMLCSREWPIDLRNAITYTVARPEIDPERIALLGLSMGGSTVTYVGAFEDRVKTIVSLAAVADGKKWLQQIWIEQKGLLAWKQFLTEIEIAQKIKNEPNEMLTCHLADMLARDEDDRSTMEEWHRVFPYYILKVPLASVESVLNFRPINVVNQSKCPILFIHGREDTLVPCQHSRLLFEKAQPPKEYFEVPDAGHDLLIGNCKEEVQKMILDWFQKWL